ncbi:uncharacterized protein FIESC28_03108 [Fusarium coffeatum]|uniref:BTB domain-containing protein n=1 Tax=Fusarium coffeatum TaxID=231269 RepID=A0A366S486_9HYPO|nr:uncharacterized protein FIESC28_03108 [Fusarium coffeatum]RBR24109.1 hypothetical protein FIESC28_03108 [Fusarium coffeatum]
MENTSADHQLPNTTSSYAWMERLFETGNYSDLILTSNGKDYPAHRAIVCSQSSVIHKKCEFQDTNQGSSCDTCGAALKYRFDFLDDNPQSVDCLIQYFYHRDYQSARDGHKGEQRDRTSNGNSEEIQDSDDYVDDSYPVFHVRMYALAEKYDVSALKNLAIDKFNQVVQPSVLSDEFLHGVEEAYVSTIPEDRGMRDAIVKHFHTHPKLLEGERTQETFRRIHSLPYDLLMFWHKEHTSQRPPAVSWDSF